MPSRRLPVHGGRLIGQLLPLGLAFLLGLGHRDQDPGGQPPRIGAQVDVALGFGEPHPGPVEPRDQELQVQRLADEPVPLPAVHDIDRVRVDQTQDLFIARPVLPGLGRVLAGHPDVVIATAGA